MKVFGKNPVIERLRTSPETIRKIYLQEGSDFADILRKKAVAKHIPLFIIPRAKMMKLGRNTNTQGVLAEVDDFAYANYNEILDNAFEKKKTIVFLDGINDPQNFGAIIRSLACLGRFAIVIPSHDSVSVTESVLRVASGGDNYVPIALVSNLSNAIKAAKEKGFIIAGAVVEGGKSIFEAQLRFPLGLVIGSEQKGIRTFIQQQLDNKITIPMSAQTLSFNVAQAATILAFEITRRKNEKKHQ
ncbi:MAG: 23S rRNA (guanosine(2251)-2'-O)-methyltransferase RlmB [Candidatus Omnitrophica bacterium]|nr:23S rRNA (guanosine(2251)-2'-O)-methyltransferase RlmB [Candidatus Omnitrophota bacterium]